MRSYKDFAYSRHHLRAKVVFPGKSALFILIIYCPDVILYACEGKQLLLDSMNMLDKLLKDPQFLPEVFEAMRDGLMVVDNKGRILLFNRAAEEITGYRKEEVIGRECSLFHCEACVRPG